LAVEQDNIEFVVAVKTCLPRYKKNQEQLCFLQQQTGIYYFYYYGDVTLDSEFVLDLDAHTLRVRSKDDYLNLCHKVGLMLRFLRELLHQKSQIKGVFFTDDDTRLNATTFFPFLQKHASIAYYGKTATYPEKINRSSHIVEKCQQNGSLRQFCIQNYPELVDHPILVPGVTFCAGGGFYLQRDVIDILI